MAVTRASASYGLSPHGRGNRWDQDAPRPRAGSIPARAGEPTSNPSSPTIPGVYPRTGGGTPSPECSALVEQGLSPHGRGNRRQLGIDRPDEGSIPARAGEPFQEASDRGVFRVYPRTGGGTRFVPSERSIRWGLSPHGRGNQDEVGADLEQPRSIPARAGEPCTCSW